MRRTLIVAAVALIATAASAFAADSIRGTKGDDALTGTDQADRIFALAGNDTVKAGAGDDRVHGGKGNDTLAGEDGNDKLKGGGDEDTLDGGKGDDVIDGRGDGRSADLITCGAGEDTVRAGREDVVAADCENAKTHKGRGGAKGKPPFDEEGKPGRGPNPH